MDFGIITLAITLEVCILAIGLSMDSFAVSLSNGLVYKMTRKKTLANAVIFATCQMIMPMIGFFVGKFAVSLMTEIDKYDHWIAFALLSIIGCNMFFEAYKDYNAGKKAIEENSVLVAREEVKYRTLIIQGFATSIDALAIGLSLLALNANIFLAGGAIFVATFCFCLLGKTIGNKTGDFLKNKAIVFGGLVLVGIGLKILIEHLFF